MRFFQNRRVWVPAGYISFTLVCLAISLYWTFPVEALGQRISHDIVQATGGIWHVGMRDVETYRVSGLRARGVSIRREGGGDPIVLTVDEARVRVRLLSLFLLRLSIDLYLPSPDGLLHLNLSPRGSFFSLSQARALAFSFRAQGWSLRAPDVLGKLFGLPIAGILDGELEGEVENEVTNLKGNGDFSLANFSVGPGAVNGLTLPTIDFGKLHTTFDVAQGKFKVSEFTQQGGNLRVRLGAQAQLLAPLASSQLDVCLQVKPEADFLAKSEKMRMLQQIAEITVKKDNEGFLHVPLAGAFDRLALRGGLCKR